MRTGCPRTNESGSPMNWTRKADQESSEAAQHRAGAPESRRGLANTGLFLHRDRELRPEFLAAENRAAAFRTQYISSNARFSYPVSGGATGDVARRAAFRSDGRTKVAHRDSHSFRSSRPGPEPTGREPRPTGRRHVLHRRHGPLQLPPKLLGPANHVLERGG